jgi:hypothetical protein
MYVCIDSEEYDDKEEIVMIMMMIIIMMIMMIMITMVMMHMIIIHIINIIIIPIRNIGVFISEEHIPFLLCIFYNP